MICSWVNKYSHFPNFFKEAARNILGNSQYIVNEYHQFVCELLKHKNSETLYCKAFHGTSSYPKIFLAQQLAIYEHKQKPK